MAVRDDPFIADYQSSELKIASEFLTNWLPFLTRDLCATCSQTLTNRIHSLHSESSSNIELCEYPDTKDSAPCPTESHHSHEYSDANSLGIVKENANEGCNDLPETPKHEEPSEQPGDVPIGSMSWADIAQEDELAEGEPESHMQSWVEECDMTESKVKNHQRELTREQREYIRFKSVQRKKDFICLERVRGKIVNILDGLELHSGVFSVAEQKRIVDFIYLLQEKGRKGQLKDRTYSEPRKWMPGKGRVTIQFGCCYNYASDKNGNPPGILKNELVDPVPHLLKVMIRRLVGWHVIPTTCVPDSCIVNIYEPGDCIPPHIDHHDFVRPFCTVSFLSECNILFGSNLKIEGPGEFSGSSAIPLPVGSVLVLNKNGADVAKHCVPAVPSKRISITFRRMAEDKRPFGYAPEPDLQNIKPLNYDSHVAVSEKSMARPHFKSRSPVTSARYRRLVIETNVDNATSTGEGSNQEEQDYSGRAKSQNGNRRKVRLEDTKY